MNILLDKGFELTVVEKHPLGLSLRIHDLIIKMFHIVTSFSTSFLKFVRDRLLMNLILILSGKLNCNLDCEDHSDI